MTRVDVTTLSLILLVIGVAGFVGTVLIGGLLNRSLYAVLAIIPLMMAGVAVALIVFGKGVVGATLLLGAWGLISTAVPVGWWTWLSRTLPDDADAGGGLMVATVQLAITFGAAIGGVLFDALGYQATFGLSAALLILAALLALLASPEAWRKHAARVAGA